MNFLRSLLAPSALGLMTALVAMPARAQIASSVPAPDWSFTVMLRANLPSNAARIGALASNSSVGAPDYRSDINFAAMIGGMARYDRS